MELLSGRSYYNYNVRDPQIRGPYLALISNHLYLTPSEDVSRIKMSPDFERAVRSYNKGDYIAAARDFKLLAAKGDANACYFLGYMRQAGLHAEANEARAIEYYNQAIKFDQEAVAEKLSNNPKRLDIYFLGCLIKAGFAIDKAINEQNCYAMASKAGNPYASRAYASWIECNEYGRMAIEGAEAYRKLADDQEVRYKTLLPTN